MRSRSMPAWPLLLALSACSLAFDVDSLRAGEGGAAAVTATGSSSTIAAASSTSITGATSSTGDGGTDASSTGGGGGAPSSTGGGAGGEDGSGGDGSGGNGSGGGGGERPCTGPSFCATAGLDADLCFDFDGANPLDGLEVQYADEATVLGRVEVVDAPRLSCPSAVATGLVDASTFGFAFIGIDVPAAQTHFLWSFAVQREVPAEDDFESVAYLTWVDDGTECQAFVMMRDLPAGGRMSVYAQYFDGMDWVSIDTQEADLPHLTVGEWSRVSVTLDLEGSYDMDVDVDGVLLGFALDPLCGPPTNHVNLDLGFKYSDEERSAYYDDITVRYTQ